MMFLVTMVTGVTANNWEERYVAVVYCEDWGTDGCSQEFDFSANGTLTYSAPGDSYVFIRDTSTGTQYCTDGWTDFANPVTLVNENSLSDPGKFDKFYVPSGEHTLYLVDNGDDTFTIAYDINILKKAIYVYPKAWDMTGNKIALYSWNPEMFDDLQLNMTYPQCYMIKVDNNLTSGVLVLLPETATNSFDNKLAQTSDVNFEQPDGTNGDILIVIKDETNWLNQYQWDITTIDHLDDYLTVTPTIHDPEIESACDYYNWHGITYTTSGEYQYEEKDADGNVTDIYTLQLTIYYSTAETWEREVYMGQHFEEGPFDFVVTSETELTQTGVTTNTKGCDNVITLVLTIVQGPGIDVEEAQTGYDFGEVPPGELAKIDIAVTNSANFGVQAKVTVPDGFDWEKMLLFTNNYGWEKVYLYAWDADGTPLTGAWPGTELTKTITNDYAQQQHIATIPIGTTGIIFTAGADGPQTSDISDFNVEGYYMYEGSLYSWGEEPQFAIPANSEGTLTVYLTSDDPGVRSGNIVLEPRMGDTTPIVIPISATVSTGIDSLTPDNAAKGKEIWYDLSGRRLMGEPTQHGVYINKGKKVNK